ncbi:MAG: hypothetical protein J6R81_03010 [Alistipes sp.]|nr:hypothetical protein [Alistipes sp.]
MKRLFTILAFVLNVASGFAQKPESIVVDSAAMKILSEYSGVMPIGHFHGGSSRHIPLRLRIAHDAMLPHGIDPLLWEQSKQMPRVMIEVPKYRGYDAGMWRIMIHKTQVAISNGSAYNYMLWPNDPAAYRDARTLSFPLPK